MEKPTKKIILHYKDLTIKPEDVIVEKTSSLNDTIELVVAEIEYDKENDYLIVSLDETLIRNNTYKIVIMFTGKMDDTLAGFYRSSYYNKDQNKVWLGVTQFEAISARKAFPCFDEPEMKATFDITIGRNENYTAISNMPLLETKPM